MNKKINLQEAFSMLFDLEDRIGFAQFEINNSLNRENLTQMDLLKIEKDIIDMENLIKKRNDLRVKLAPFNDIYLEID